MDILRTMQELQQYTFGNPLTIGRVTMHRKKTGGLHQGHLKLLEYAKQNCDILIVFFWSWEPVVNTIFSGRQAPEDQTWDESYCVSFCASAGVDAVWIPDYNIHTQFQIVDWDTQRTLAENIISTEGYVIESDFDLQLVTTHIALRERYKQAMIYKIDKLFDSYKDGYFMFCLKHYTNNYTTQTMDVIAPEIDPSTGIPYSSAYNLMTQDSLNYINNVRTLVENNLDLNLNFWPDENSNIDIKTVLPSEFWPYENTISNWLHLETSTNENILGTGKKYVRLLCAQRTPFAFVNIPYYFDI